MHQEVVIERWATEESSKKVSIIKQWKNSFGTSVLRIYLSTQDSYNLRTLLFMCILVLQVYHVQFFALIYLSNYPLGITLVTMRVHINSNRMNYLRSKITRIYPFK